MSSQSMSSGPACERGDLVPGKVRTGRTLAYSCRGERMARRRPQSEIWSGTSRGISKMSLGRSWGFGGGYLVLQRIRKDRHRILEGLQGCSRPHSGRVFCSMRFPMVCE
jgi:hypothetical protein